MDQTPVYDSHNPDLLRLIPDHSVDLIDIGFSSGALARESKRTNPVCHYYGIDIDPDYVELANRFCDQTAALNIDDADEECFKSNGDRDCWIFGDTLEHLKDPWRVQKLIRANMPADGSITACIPNAQHWSMLARLSVGDFRYEDSGLLDRTHLRWFARQTIVDGLPQDIPRASTRLVSSDNRRLPKAAGAEPEAGINDLLAIQYVIRAVPS